MTVVLWIIAVLLIIAGMLGTLFPGLPGVPFVFLGLLLAAWADHFERVGALTIIVLAVLTLASVGFDILATSLGTKRAGASRLAVAGAILGALAGLFFGLPGIVLGPFLGALAGEYLNRRDLRRAGKAGLGAWAGLVIGTAARVALAFAMLGIFIVSYIF
jgi:uncharacterized protein YqgC (DUF456 family)